MIAAEYQTEPTLGAKEFIDLLERSTLSERRPVDNEARIEAMLRNADIIATARCDGLLVGVARALTDFCFCCYLSDLAVDEAFQRQGIGTELLRQVGLEAGEHTKIILIAAPKAVDYYPRTGMVRHESCWVTP
ncbi:MAG: GNAT family N-acetyltransferase [Verrucomicrobiales bacterium]|nr:GNAT family N-acetyltransferase [Verrucomicrobiales bacterium]HQW29577.1 GNAT family N-acetyltransferase [Verrucomicrobiales bacterium]